VIDVIIPVHNGARVIGETLEALLAQAGRGSAWQRIVVVDDGSDDDTASQVSRYASDGVILVRGDQRGGRANACNLGASSVDGKRLLFLDADCRPAKTDLLARHAALGRDSERVVVGTIDAEGEGFWQRFARRLADRRARAAAADDWLALTSCNLSLSRELFESVGGFHPGYRHYGFEDRDLLLRLQRAGAGLAFDAEARVIYDVDSRVVDLCDKQYSAGRYAALVFRERFPNAYQQMPYARVDVHTAGWPVRLASPALAGLAPLVAGWAERVVATWPVGDRARRFVVLVATALAYLRGTRAQLSDR
jgi:glycosyltransferase involved in cell wall biosynthesis